MPNPGAFQGSRKAFLTSKKMEFTRSVNFGYTNELLATIQRQYFKRYPIDLPHTEEPSAEHLAAVDDDAADPEVEEPDEALLGAEEYRLAMEKIGERRILVAKRKAQIKRWFIYQYMKDHDADPRDQCACSPYQVYLSKLRGGDGDKPRRKSSVNIWRKFHRERIEKMAKLTAERENISKSGMATLRDKIARDLFAALPREEQREWDQTSLEDHKHAIEEWERARTRDPSTDPADRQRAIQGLVRFVQPVLNAIADSTGWKVSLFAGGPEPAQEGQLNVISVHSGTTTGDIKLSFGQSERASIKKDFIPIYGAFLQKCYTPEECRARALSEMDGFVPISDMEMEGGDAMIHPLGPDTAVGTASTPTPPAASSQAIVPAVAPAVVPTTSIASSNPAPIGQPAQNKDVPSSSKRVAPASLKPPALPIPSGAVANIIQPSAASTLPSSAPPSQPTVTSQHTVACDSGTGAERQPAAPPAAPTIDDQSGTAISTPGSRNGDSGNGDEENDDEGEGEGFMPLVYRLPDETPASPFPQPASPPLSRQGSIAPSPPPSPSLAAAPHDATTTASAPPVSLSSPPAAAALILLPPPPSTSTPSPDVGPQFSPALDSAKRPVAKKGGRRNAVAAAPSDSSSKETSRPRRDLKKTEKALRIEEEEMSRKNRMGKKRTRGAIDDSPQVETAPTKRLRGARRRS